MIPGSKEFFIAAVDHKEWGAAHTVWGVVSVSEALCVALELLNAAWARTPSCADLSTIANAQPCLFPLQRFPPHSHMLLDNNVPPCAT